MKTIIIWLTCLLISVGAIAQSNTTDAEQHWHFNVFLDGKAIGYHNYDLIRSGDDTEIDIKAEFDVKFLFISVYDYLHTNHEVWKGNCLSSLTSNTDDNGDKVFVKLSSESNIQTIQMPNETITTVECLRSFAYWNPELLKDTRLLNAQTGEVVDAQFSYVGKESININKLPINAEHYQIKGKELDIDLWYSTNKVWLALQSVTDGGHVLRYERQAQELQ